jgi:peptide/nickel transport system substrate-binding protein
VQTVRYQSYTGNDALTTALATGQAQWGWTFISNYQSVYVNKDSEHNKAWFPAGLGIDALYLNTQKAPFNDVAVRKAANQVLDRQKASAIAEAGIFPELTSVTGIPTPAGDSFIAADFKGQNYKVDVAGAKKTLTDAGYKYDGDKLIGKDGKQVSVTLTDPAGWNDYDSDLSLIQTSFKSIGIDAKVTTPTADAWTTALNQGDFQATLHWTNGGVTPWEMYSNMFDPAYYVPLGKNATWNFGRYNDPTAKKYFADYLAATDDAGRSAALDQLQKIWVEDVPALGVDQRPAGAEFSTKYFTGWPGDDNPYANPQPSSVMASLVLTSLKPAS